MSKTLISEKDIAAAVRKYLEGQGLVVRGEVPVTLPDHGQVFADLVGCKAGELGDTFVVVECKRRLDDELESQANRWRDHANQVVVAYQERGRISSANAHRATRMDAHGIGRIVVGAFGIHVVTDAIFDGAIGTSTLSAAFHSHDGSLDPAAGSAAAKRMTPAKCEWESLRAFLGRALPDQTWVWSGIRNNVPELRRFTASAVRKAIDKGECVGVGYRGRAITEFYATSTGEKK